MCDDYDDEPTLSRFSTRRARKPHVCGACRETIRRGDNYRRTGVLFDGAWTEFRHCMRCWTMAEMLQKLTRGSVQMDLDCGEVLPHPTDEQAALAFLTRDEAQALSRRGA